MHDPIALEKTYQNVLAEHFEDMLTWLVDEIMAQIEYLRASGASRDAIEPEILDMISFLESHIEEIEEHVSGCLLDEQLLRVELAAPWVNFKH
ncbi:MAG: hypothetical protein Kow0069_02640 [Promethearchaeota archaeon]